MTVVFDAIEPTTSITSHNYLDDVEAIPRGDAAPPDAPIQRTTPHRQLASEHQEKNLPSDATSMLNEVPTKNEDFANATCFHRARVLQLQCASHVRSIERLQEILRDYEESLEWQDERLGGMYRRIEDLEQEVERAGEEARCVGETAGAALEEVGRLRGLLRAFSSRSGNEGKRLEKGGLEVYAGPFECGGFGVRPHTTSRSVVAVCCPPEKGHLDTQLIQQETESFLRDSTIQKQPVRTPKGQLWNTINPPPRPRDPQRNDNVEHDRSAIFDHAFVFRDEHLRFGLRTEHVEEDESETCRHSPGTGCESWTDSLTLEPGRKTCTFCDLKLIIEAKDEHWDDWKKVERASHSCTPPQSPRYERQGILRQESEHNLAEEEVAPAPLKSLSLPPKTLETRDSARREGGDDDGSISHSRLTPEAGWRTPLLFPNTFDAKLVTTNKEGHAENGLWLEQPIHGPSSEYPHTDRPRCCRPDVTPSESAFPRNRNDLLPTGAVEMRGEERNEYSSPHYDSDPTIDRLLQAYDERERMLPDNAQAKYRTREISHQDPSELVPTSWTQGTQQPFDGRWHRSVKRPSFPPSMVNAFEHQSQSACEHMNRLLVEPCTLESSGFQKLCGAVVLGVSMRRHDKGKV